MRFLKKLGKITRRFPQKSSKNSPLDISQTICIINDEEFQELSQATESSKDQGVSKETPPKAAPPIITTSEQLKRLRSAIADIMSARHSIVRFLDKDSNGYVDYDEFYDFLYQFGLAHTAKINPREVFSILDTKDRGAVPTDILLEALTVIDDEEDPLADTNTAIESNKEALAVPPFQSPLLVALVAHNNMKLAMIKFVKDHLSFFRRVKLITTASTGQTLAPLGLKVEHKVSSGPLGGDLEIASLIVQGRVSSVFFFTDPLSSHPHDADVTALNRVCCVHDVMFANNVSSAKLLVYGLEHSTFGFSRLIGRNPDLGKESKVVESYKEGQARIVKRLYKNEEQLSAKGTREKKSSLRMTQRLDFTGQIQQVRFNR